LVQVTPSQGDLEAYSSAEIRTTVMGRYDESDIQTFCNHILGKSTNGMFEKEWTYTIRAHLSHDEQHLDLAMKGTSMVPRLSLTPTYLEFGTTALQQKQKKSFKIENFSSKAITIEFDNSGNYSFTPQKIKLSSQGQTKIQVTFCPKKVGDLNEICCLNTGVFSFPIKLFGKGIFSAKGDNSICEELPIDGLNGSCLEE